MGLLARVQVRRMMRTFKHNYLASLGVWTHVPTYTPLLSDYAQAFSVARTFATKDERLTTEVEKRFVGAALEFALPHTGSTYSVFVDAVNIKLLLKNPRDHEHARELHERLDALDAQHAAAQGA